MTPPSTSSAEVDSKWLAGKKGSLLAEAAILFPVVILSILSLLAYGADLFQNVASQTGSWLQDRQALLSEGPIDRDEDVRIRLTDAWNQVLREE